MLRDIFIKRGTRAKKDNCLFVGVCVMGPGVVFVTLFVGFVGALPGRAIRHDGKSFVCKFTVRS